MDLITDTSDLYPSTVISNSLFQVSLFGVFTQANSGSVKGKQPSLEHADNHIN